ncbi:MULTISPECIES: aminotransferase class I/II-fold pyridoxal phosphate-dependent enzyme [unclassified Caballeronia]|uniref:pyridoxal phosphate-dependent aminotransferase n=1 Tax=unclassified Caballeronia TaxID=2646786 RepID=UPI002860391A|nr:MULTISPECIES: aminotransferase class I/II-fold pyridoxal phosphate-dependent enzyme [unclassified Caballeronia]MDR5776477.1 aminotransferase class I/II-fold pyridoxal phosphate-dependent enzyme [Caballeronia sp. LZ002]MDR5851741.1 aminotransferase class I/II-fold pyridoxal phosphate-dependent enzyme [Caballeronia sp. LZ003]
MKLAKRITETSKKSYGMYEKARNLPGDTSDVIHLELGCPHADTPMPIKQATIDALLRGDVHYSDMRGLPALRQALADKLRTRNKLDVTENDILVTNGLTHASFAAFFALIDQGDEVILLAPYYPQHIGKIEMAGGKPVVVDLDRKNFSIDAGAIERAITPRTRAIVIVNPANPTGRVYTRDELSALADIAIRHDLAVLSDEVYEEIVYDGARHVSIGSLPGMKERTLSMFAFTKSHAMDGWRVGFMTAPADVMPALLKITANDVTHVNTFIQAGALAAVSGDRAMLERLVNEDAQKRAIVVESLNAMRNVQCASPEGTIYAFPDISATGLSAQECADRILIEARVVVEAGSFYGAAGEGHLRVCFGSESKERIVEAMQRLHTFFDKL